MYLFSRNILSIYIREWYSLSVHGYRFRVFARTYLAIRAVQVSSTGPFGCREPTEGSCSVSTLPNTGCAGFVRARSRGGSGVWAHAHASLYYVEGFFFREGMGLRKCVARQSIFYIIKKYILFFY